MTEIAIKALQASTRAAHRGLITTCHGFMASPLLHSPMATHRHSPADDRSRRSGCRCLGQGRIRLPVGELRGGKSELPPSRFRYAWPGSRLVLEGSELTCSDIVTIAQCSGRGG